MTLLGVCHRLQAGVPVLLLSDGRATLSLDAVLQAVSHMSRLRLESWDLRATSPKELDEALAEATGNHLMALRSDCCGLAVGLATLERAFERCAPFDRFSRRAIIGAVTCSAEEVNTLPDVLLDAVVFLRTS